MINKPINRTKCFVLIFFYDYYLLNYYLFCLLSTTYYLLPTAYCLLPTTYYLLLTYTNSCLRDYPQPFKLQTFQTQTRNVERGKRNMERGTCYLFNSIIIFNVRSKKTIFAFAFCSICRSANPNSFISCSTFRSLINGENRLEKSDSNDVK